MTEILLVEDEAAHADLVRRAFEKQGASFHLTITATIASTREYLRQARPALIISDWRLPDGEGTELINPDIPVIIMTSHGNERVAVDAIKAGALDYLVKSETALMDMPHTAERALREWQYLLKQKQVEHELRLRVSDLEAVNRISTTLRSTETLEKMVEQLMSETLSILNTQDGALWLFQTDTNSLDRVFGQGSFVANLPKNMEPQSDSISTVFIKGQPLMARDFSLIFNHAQNLSAPQGWGGICLPIRTSQETIGVLLIAVEQPRILEEREIYLVTTLAEIAGGAIYRTKLFEQSQRNIRRLFALRSIDMAITSSMDLTLSLNILVEHARAQLNVDAVALLTLNDQAQTLDFFTGRGFETNFALRTQLRLGEGYPGLAALERRPIFAPDLSVTGDITGRGELSTSELFRAYYVVPLITKGHVKGVLEIFNRSPIQPEPEWLNFLDSLAGQAAIAIENSELFENLQKSNFELVMAYDATIEGWSRALDLRDRETEGHTRRVTDMTMQLARRLGLKDEELVHIHRGALLHDIGKMGVSDKILLKTGPLDPTEWEVMRQHPLFAFQMLSPIQYLRPALDIPYCHHERWDGTGYPRGLKGEQIPLPARIFSVVDAWDALRSNRPYRPAWTDAKVHEYLKEKSATHFDPSIVDAFLNLIQFTQ